MSYHLCCMFCPEDTCPDDGAQLVYDLTPVLGAGPDGTDRLYYLEACPAHRETAEEHARNMGGVNLTWLPREV
jgi:hypothetical protein